MEFNASEIMPWGLTMLQSVQIGCACLGLLAGWLVLQYIVKMTKLIFTIGLLTVLGIACCGGVVFYMTNQ